MNRFRQQTKANALSLRDMSTYKDNSLPKKEIPIVVLGQNYQADMADVCKSRM